MRNSPLLSLVAALAVAGLGCSGGGSSSSRSEALPAYYPASQLQRYVALNDSGYQHLRAQRADEAIAVFQRQHEMIPTGRLGAINVARAYASKGNVEEGIRWIETAVAAGWDDSAQLREDPALAPLRSDARFAPLVDRVDAALAEREAVFAKGLPEHDSKSVALADAAALKAWSDSLGNQLVIHGRTVWFNWQFTAARMDFEARQLAARQKLAAGDPTFDYGLERVRAISRLRSPEEPWGAVAKGVAAEVDRYLAGTPTADGRVEAQYRAGVAALCELGPVTAPAPGWTEAAARARAHFAQVGESTRFFGATTAWLLWADLVDAGENASGVLPRIRVFAEQFKGDRAAMEIADAKFKRELFVSLWPIPFAAVDLDDKPVTLDDYKGKVLLLDFWATWCGPCRQELPHLRDAFAQFHERGFEILSVSLDFADRTTVADYRAWTEENGMRWRHVYDQKGWQSPLVSAFRIQGIPFPLLIGPDGDIIAMHGECRGENLKRVIDRALTELGA
ncbi:MAG: redoxin domain-containing protein [bacterium]